MNKKFKRLLAIGLSVVMMISSSMMVFAAEKTASEEAIIEEIIAMDDKLNIRKDEYKIVTLSSNSTEANTRSSEQGTKAIQVEETVDDVTTLITILPFKKMEDGSVMNSFEYAESNVFAARGTGYTYTMVDIYVTLIVDYETVIVEQGSNDYLICYRHRGVQGYWTADSAESQVQYMRFNFKTTGVCYNYPALTLDNGSYENNIELEVSRPEIGVTYSKYDILSDEYVIYTEPGDAGAVLVDIVFYANGQDGNYIDSYVAFGG